MFMFSFIQIFLLVNWLDDSSMVLIPAKLPWHGSIFPLFVLLTIILLVSLEAYVKMLH